VPLTVEWLLNQNSLTQLECVAGQGGLNNEIKSAIIMENPDTLRWLKGGEFIITTGYSFKDNNMVKNNIIKDLSNCGCCGIGIKIKRYFDEIPEVIIKQANELGFPVIKIPYTVTLSQISRLIYKNIFKNELSEVENIYSIYKQLTDIVVQGRDLNELLSSVSEIVSNPVFIADENWELIAYEIPDSNIIQINDFISTEIAQSLFKQQDIQKIDQDFNEKNYTVVIKPLMHDYKTINCIIFQVKIDGSLAGYICFLETQKQFASADYALIENINSIIGLELIRYNILKQSRKNIKSDFVNTVVMGKLTKEEDLISQCNLYGFDYTKNRVCLVIKLSDLINLYIDKRKFIENKVLSVVNNIALNSSIQNYSFAFNNSIIVFLLYSARKDKAGSINQSLEISKLISSRLKENNIECKIGIGKCYKGLFTISNSFNQAIKALNIGEHIDPKQTVHSYFHDIVYHIISNALTVEEQRELYEETVSKLDSFDRENNSDFILTLDRFFECNLNMSETAKSLHIHRNTMLNRMEKIREILNVDFDDAEERSRIQLGLKIIKLNFYEKD
jgi:sugar diacid utilization regulator